MKSIKQLRAESILQKAITEIILQSFGSVATVDCIDVTADIKDAKVKLCINKDFEHKDALKAVIKSKISKKISLRNTPRLTFSIQTF